MELEENMRLIAARIFWTEANKNFDLIYLVSPGNYARYAWTNRPGETELWQEFNVNQVKRWFCDNPSQTVMVCPELVPAIAGCVDAGHAADRKSVKRPPPVPAARANSETLVVV